MYNLSNDFYNLSSNFTNLSVLYSNINTSVQSLTNLFYSNLNINTNISLNTNVLVDSPNPPSSIDKTHFLGSITLLAQPPTTVNMFLISYLFHYYALPTQVNITSRKLSYTNYINGVPTVIQQVNNPYMAQYCPDDSIYGSFMCQPPIVELPYTINFSLNISYRYGITGNGNISMKNVSSYIMSTQIK